MPAWSSGWTWWCSGWALEVSTWPAGRLAEAGLAVVGIDAELVGGECPYWGCVPSKMMIRAANLVAEARRIDGMARTATVTPDWGPVARGIRDEATDDWDDRVAIERLASKGARVVKGWARLDGPGRVVVGHDVYVSDRVVLNIGARPWAPPIPGLADLDYWSNRELIEAEALPGSLVILGGGAIGVELGQAVRRFGVEVTIVEGSDRLLAAEEPEASALIHRVLTAEGRGLVTGARVTGAGHHDDRFVLGLEGYPDVVGERLRVATSRRPDQAGLGVATIGLDETARSVPTDGRLRAAPGVWAIGDMTGVGAFTHVSMYQAAIGPPTSWIGSPPTPTTGPCPGSPSRTPRSPRSA